MAAPRRGVCAPWLTAELLGELPAGLPPGIDGDFVALAASNLLYALSGRQFPGECTATLRPCSRPERSWQGRRPVGLCTCSSVERCGCGGLDELGLGVYPVLEVVAVHLDGATLEAGVDYRLDEHRYLVRLPDTEGRRRRWPCCPNMAAPAEQVGGGAFVVEVKYGQPAPPEGVIAARALAQALAGDVAAGRCKLPAGTTAVARQGVTRTIAAKAYQELPEVAVFLAAVNPRGHARRPAIASPGSRGGTRRVG